MNNILNFETMEKILQKIKEYDRILIFRHFRPDGDAVGSTKGLQAILRATYPEKEILLCNDDYAQYLEFLGPEDGEIPEEKFADALGIAVDTGTIDRLSSKKFELCKETIKIDHHIDNNPYGDISWVEDFRSAACEMIAHFYDTFRDELVMTKDAAFYLYTGMVTDSGRFKYDGVTGDTLRLAGILLDQGINTEWLFANLYLDEFDQLKFKAHVLEKMQITENGVAYMIIDKAMQEEFNLTQEDASASISYLDSIKGCLSWLAFIESGDEKGTIRVRLRSRFVPINTVAENYRGGGHAYASGATVYTMEEVHSLIAEADAVIKEYKETHEGWL
ncbi:MAG: bifunctional oligoribonuclease/PAP phosphatase NrnA [Lachnospiraceae bacterium]|nr:bifunctional oligoribonuclease/PAP phosphatase NrnA [Lachnospiraceae bacterium]